MPDAPHPYALKKFTAASFAATRTAWTAQLRARRGDVLETHYIRILDWAENHIDYRGPQCANFAYGIFYNDSSSAVAIVELVYQKAAKKWLKLLDLNLCPEVDIGFISSEDIDFHKLTYIYAAAVLGTADLTNTAHPTKVVKLYGRSGTLLAFLKGLGTYIERDSTVTTVKVSIDGRWLVVKAQ